MGGSRGGEKGAAEGGGRKGSRRNEGRKTAEWGLGGGDKQSGGDEGYKG